MPLSGSPLPGRRPLTRKSAESSMRGWFHGGRDEGGRRDMSAITDEYAPFRRLDVHGDGGDGVVLLWHGRAANSRGALAGLAAVIASEGKRVVVPDWDCDEPDGGRSAL